MSGESVSPLLGNWVFSTSSIEVVSNPLNLDVNDRLPNINGLEWTFMDNDSVLISSLDTAYSSWYRYDSIEMSLEFPQGSYDVLKLKDDSLSLGFLTDFDAFSLEYYSFFELLRGEE